MVDGAGESKEEGESSSTTEMRDMVGADFHGGIELELRSGAWELSLCSGALTCSGFRVIMTLVSWMSTLTLSGSLRTRTIKTLYLNYMDSLII